MGRYKKFFQILCLIFFSFFLVENVQAVDLSDGYDFDDLANGSKINELSDFASSSEFILVSNATSSSPNNSIAVLSVDFQYYYFEPMTKIGFTFNLDDTPNDNNCINAYIYNKNDTDIVFNLSACNGSTVDDLRAAYFGTSTTPLTIKSNDTLDNGWHTVLIEYVATSSVFQFYIDGVLFGSTITTDNGFNEELNTVKWQGLTGYNSYIDDVLVRTYDEVVIMPPIDYDNLRVQVGSEYFDYTNPLICIYDAVPEEACIIRIYYTYNDIGSSVYLMDHEETKLINNTDYIDSLADADQLIDSLFPTTRSASTTDYYYIFVWNSTLQTSELYGEVLVNWISSSTINDISTSTKSSFIKKYFGRIFPLSIIYQVKEIFDKYGSETDTTKFTLTFNDFLPSAYSKYTSTSTVFSASLINDNISWWQTKVYPALQAFIWLITLIIIFFEIKSLGNSDTN